MALALCGSGVSREAIASSDDMDANDFSNISFAAYAAPTTHTAQSLPLEGVTVVLSLASASNRCIRSSRASREVCITAASSS